jgi:hypothetical protein
MYLVELSQSGPQWQASKPMEEQSLWDAHARFMDELVDSGFIVLGGPLGAEGRVVHAVVDRAPALALSGFATADSVVRADTSGGLERVGVEAKGR